MIDELVLVVTTRRWRAECRERVRRPKLRKGRRFGFWHYRRRPRRCCMLQDPLTMTRTAWPGRTVLHLLGAEGF